MDYQGTGIYNDGYSNVELKGCEIKRFEEGIGFTSFAEGAYIHHNYIHDNYGSGIQVSGPLHEQAPGIRVEYNHLIDNTSADDGCHIHVSWAFEAVISYNTLSSPTADPDRNHIGIHYDAAIGGELSHNMGGVLAIALGAGGGSYGVTIANNEIMGSSTPDLAAIVGCGGHDDIVEFNTIHDGINGVCWNGENFGITTRNNIFYNLSGRAANINCDPAICPPDRPNYFYNNIVYNSNMALGIATCGVAENNIFVGNLAGIHDEGGGVYDFNTFWNNDIDYSYLATASPGDVLADPLFVSTEPGHEDFYLRFDSPCIDVGDPQAHFNDQCFPPSMGTERNDMGAYGGPEACGWVCWDQDIDGYYDEACGGSDCDDMIDIVNPGQAEVRDNDIDDDCDGFIDEPLYGDMSPFGESDGRWSAADFNLSVECLLSAMGFSEDEVVLLDVAPIVPCDEKETLIRVAPEPDGLLDVYDLTVLLQAASGYVEIVPYCQ